MVEAHLENKSKASVSMIWLSNSSTVCNNNQLKFTTHLLRFHLHLYQKGKEVISTMISLKSMLMHAYSHRCYIYANNAGYRLRKLINNHARVRAWLPTRFNHRY